jgi:hypothetical protein
MAADAILGNEGPHSSRELPLKRRIRPGGSENGRPENRYCSDEDTKSGTTDALWHVTKYSASIIPETAYWRQIGIAGISAICVFAA